MVRNVRSSLRSARSSVVRAVRNHPVRTASIAAGAIVATAIVRKVTKSGVARPSAKKATRVARRGGRRRRSPTA